MTAQTHQVEEHAESKKKIPIKVGISNGSRTEVLEGLKDGTIDSVVVQDPFQMGFKSFVAAVTKLKGGTPGRIQDITPALVTKANVDNPEIQRRINPDLDKYLK